MSEPSPPKRRLRPLRWLFLLAGLLVLVAAVAPWVLGPLARGPVERAIEDQVNATASLGELSLAHGGVARVRDLVLRHLDGRPLLEVESADADVGLLAVLKGEYGLELDVRGVTVHARLDENGELDLKDVVRGGEEGEDERPRGGKPRGQGRDETEREEPPAALPRVRARIRVSDVTVHLETPEGPAEITDGALRLDVEDLSELADFVLSATVSALPAGLLPPDVLRPDEPFALDARGSARYRPETGLVELAAFTFETPLVRGEMKARVDLAGSGDGALVVESCEGELRYVPDRVAPLLADTLPGELSGSADQRVAFRFSGAPPSDLASLLGGNEAHLDVGLGRFAAWGLAGDGSLKVDLTGGIAQLGGSWAANAGSLSLTGVLDARTPGEGVAPRTFLRFQLDGVGANAQLAPLLGYLHPVFAGLDGVAEGLLDGVLSAQIEIGLDGSLDVAALAEDPAALLQLPLNGGGRLELRGLKLAGSPLVASLVQNLGATGEQAVGEGIDVQPIEFSIDAGRLSYAEPWTWSIGGVETSFTGSIGLDRGLDLSWNVPVTEALVERYDFLASVAGETLSVPLGGTLEAPRLDWGPAVASLAKGALTREAAERLGLGELGGELGDGLGLDDLAGLAGLGGKQGAEGKESADELYRRAGKLWDQGKREEAVALYKRLRDEHRLTLVYTLHRGRIKDRIGWLDRKRKKEKKRKRKEQGGG